MLKPHYFEGELSPGFVALLSGRLVQFIIDGMLGLFLPIFLYTKLNYSLSNMLLYYGSVWLVYALVLPLGAQLLTKIGLRRAIRISVFFDGFFLMCFYFIEYSPTFFLILSLVMKLFAMLFFWIPYHTDFAKFTTKNDRGKEYSVIQITSTVMGVILPLASGYFISVYGFKFVFALSIVLAFAAYLPFLMLPRTKEKFSWGYKETFGHFFSPKNKGLVLAHMASGAENIVGMLVWPIFIWLLLQGKFFEVGVISTFISGATVVLQLAVGNWTDKFDKRRLLKWGSALYAFGWVVKIIIATAFQIFIAGVYHSFSSIIMRTPFDSLNYEIAADQGHYVDEFTVIREMAIQFGRVLMIAVIVTMTLFIGIKWAFILAALASLAFNLVPEEELLDIHERVALREGEVV